MEQSLAVLRNGQRTIIAADDYNPETDTLWVDAVAESATLGISPALALINGSSVARDVAIIPTLGQSAAKLLIERRPEGGYSSMAQVWEVCPELLAPPYTADIDAIARWGG